MMSAKCYMEKNKSQMFHWWFLSQAYRYFFWWHSTQMEARHRLEVQFAWRIEDQKRWKRLNWAAQHVIGWPTKGGIMWHQNGQVCRWKKSDSAEDAATPRTGHFLGPMDQQAGSCQQEKHQQKDHENHWSAFFIDVSWCFCFYLCIYFLCTCFFLFCMYLCWSPTETLCQDLAGWPFLGGWRAAPALHRHLGTSPGRLGERLQWKRCSQHRHVHGSQLPGRPAWRWAYNLRRRFIYRKSLYIIRYLISRYFQTDTFLVRPADFHPDFNLTVSRFLRRRWIVRNWSLRAAFCHSPVSWTCYARNSMQTQLQAMQVGWWGDSRLNQWLGAKDGWILACKNQKWHYRICVKKIYSSTASCGTDGLCSLQVMFIIVS